MSLLDLGVLDGPVLVFGEPCSNLRAARGIRGSFETGLWPSCDVLPPAESAR